MYFGTRLECGSYFAFLSFILEKLYSDFSIMMTVKVSMENQARLFSVFGLDKGLKLGVQFTDGYITLHYHDGSKVTRVSFSYPIDDGEYVFIRKL